MFILGCMGFALFFLGDFNDHKLRMGPLKLCFSAGCLLLVLATAAQCSWPQGLAAWMVLGLALLFLGLVVYSLFFALPARDAYVEQSQGRPLNDWGVYALCRHPGVLFFIPAYLCLSLSCGLPAGTALVYSGLNLLLILYEDVFVFPQVLAGYDQYKKRVPFLIPNARSVRACIQDFQGK